MKSVTVVLLYTIMSIVDCAILWGFYTIVKEGWSPWWAIPTLFVMGGTSPRRLVRIIFNQRETKSAATIAAESVAVTEISTTDDKASQGVGRCGPDRIKRGTF